MILEPLLELRLQVFSAHRDAVIGCSQVVNDHIHEQILVVDFGLELVVADYSLGRFCHVPLSLLPNDLNLRWILL